MKTFSILLIIIVIIALSAIITKPSDEQCIELIKSKINVAISTNTSNQFVSSIASVLVDVGVKKTLFRIEDKIFYKNIYFIIGGEQIGTAFFGTAIIQSSQLQ